MGGRAAGDDAGRGPLRRVAVAACLGLAVLTGCSGGGSGGANGGGAQVRITSAPLDRLNAAVVTVSRQRSAVLSAVEAVQVAASALDATDAVCATGEGVAARTSHRKAAPLTADASSKLDALRDRLTAYRTSLHALTADSGAVTGASREALQQVVSNGEKEAEAVEAFRQRAKGVWPQYLALDGFEQLWITRAVTPWYRSDQEGSDAYLVMVEDQRPALSVARTRLGRAVAAVGPAIATQAQTLTAADRALTSYRAKAGK